MAAKLYPISPPKIILSEFIPKLQKVLETARPDYFQLRLKDIPRAEIIIAAREIIPICHNSGTKFIINDFVDIALEVNADGLHIGSDDGDIATIRAQTGNMVLGVSCYNSIEAAKLAEEAGANYVSFGAFFPTTTKVAKVKAEIETIVKWKSVSKIPCAAIGGITTKNSAPLIEARADYICMISALWRY